MFKNIIEELESIKSNFNSLVSEIDYKSSKIALVEEFLPYVGVRNLIKYDFKNVDFITSIIFMYNQEVSYDELRDKITQVMGLMNDVQDLRLSKMLIALCRDLKDNNKLSPIKRGYYRLKLPSDVDPDVFFELCEFDGENIFDKIFMLRDIKYHQIELNGIADDPELLPSDKNRLLDYLSHSEDYIHLSDSIQNLKAEANDLVEQYRKFKREVNKNIKLCDSIIEMLSNNINSKELFNKIYESLSSIDSFNHSEVLLSEKFLEEFIKIKEKELEKLEEKRDELSTDSNAVKISLLNDYDININDEPLSKKMNILKIKISELKDRLDFMKLINTKDTTVLINLTTNKITTFNEDISNRFISTYFLANHLELILDKNFDNYNKIKTILSNTEIGLFFFSRFLDVYLFKANMVDQNIRILTEYNLITSLKNVTNIEFLNNDELNKKIDLLLELGFEDILIDHIDILNYSYNSLKKIYLLRELDFSLSTYEELVNYLNKDDLLILNKDIDNYLFASSLIIPNDIVELLNEENEFFMEEEGRTLMFSDVLVSKVRFMKNYSKLKDLDIDDNTRKFYAIIYGANYTFNDVEKLADALKVNIVKIKKL